MRKRKGADGLVMGSIEFLAGQKRRWDPLAFSANLLTWGWRLPLVKSCTLHCRGLTPIAFCMSGEGQSVLQKACADSPRSFPRLIRIAPQVAAGVAFVELSTVAASRWLFPAAHRGTPVAHAKLKITRKT